MRESILAAPPLPHPVAGPFESQQMVERWQRRADAAGIVTPPLLARLLATFDANRGTRSALRRGLPELDPEATLDDDLVDMLADMGELRQLVGFARDCEGIPIGLVAGESAVYSYADRELYILADDVDDWIEQCCEELADDDEHELIARIRELLGT